MDGAILTKMYFAIMKHDAALFFSSMLLFLFAGLLYAWGSPSWFSLFPYSTGLRFLLALEAYFLCCAFFFSLRIASFLSKNNYAFAIQFCTSFTAIPVFAALVLLNFPIQSLRSFMEGFDIVVWLAIMALEFRKPTKDRLVFSALFLISGILLLLPAIPSIVPIAARFLFLALFSVRYFQATQLRQEVIPVREPADFRDAAERFALSPRETEVLALLISGKTNNEIAGSLFISLSTVKTHIASIFGKTGARNRLEVSALWKKS